MMYTLDELQNFAKREFNMNETELMNAIVNYYVTGNLGAKPRPVAMAVGLADYC